MGKPAKKRNSSKSPNAKKVPNQYKIPAFGYEKDDFPKKIESLPQAQSAEDSFHINHLKTKFRDLARPNQFKVKITPPRIIGNEWNKDFEVLVKSVSFPSVEIEEYALERAGATLHIPTNKINYGDLTITFWNDMDFHIRTLMNRWQRLCIFNWQKDIGCIPLLALDGEISIIQYDSEHKPIYAVQLDCCWPKTISEIELNHENDSQAETFTATFAFTRHEVFAHK